MTARTRLAFALALLPLLPALMLALGLLHPPPMPAPDAWSTRVLDRSGALIAATPTQAGTWRFPTQPSAVSPLFTQMLLAVEDRRFADWPGVDPLAILRAAAGWARTGHARSGASTLSMQVARLLDPRPRTLGAKLLEASRALALRARLGRDAVLGLWLSSAPFGGNLVGVEAASRAWFGKPATALDPAEAALLVAIPRRPEALRPDRHPQAARLLRDRILRLAAARSLLTPAELATALAEPVPAARQPMPLAWPQRLARLHAPPALATTLEAGLQAALARVSIAALARLPPRVSLAIMVADLPTRELRAVWAGAWGDPARAGALDLTRATRSPGSALKPFLYGLAFADGLAGPDTLLADAPARYGGYAPEDFSGRFAGRVTAAEALRRSLNVPAVGLLARYGPQRFAAALRAAGEGLLLPRGAAPSLPLVLGGAGQTLGGMMALYAALATDGAVTPLRWREGPAAPSLRLLPPATAAVIAGVLTRSVPDHPGLDGVAWKTGTSWGDRDNWAFGFDRAQLVGVWLGRPDGTAMAGGEAADTALPLLADVMALLPRAPRPAPRTATPLSLATAPAADPLRLLFPPPGAVLEGGGPLSLRASGGTRPLAFLVDGTALPSTPALRETPWTPPGPGFYRIVVLDAAGRAQQASVRVRADPGGSAE